MGITASLFRTFVYFAISISVISSCGNNHESSTLNKSEEQQNDVMSQSSLFEKGSHTEIQPISSQDSLDLIEIYGDKFCYAIREGLQVRSGLWKEVKNDVVVSQGYYFPFVMCTEVVDTVLFDEPGDTSHFVIDYELVYIKDSLWNYYNNSGKLMRMETYHRGRLVEVENF